MSASANQHGQAPIKQEPLLPYRRVYTGMPVFNGEQYLEESILSNLSQTFDDFGLIIADNGSTDRTSEICQDYVNQDPRVIYLRNDVNVGAAGNYVKCFESSNCEYFRWSNSDDLIDSTLIANCVKVLDELPDVVLAYGKTRLIDGDGQLIENYNDNLHLQQDNAADRFIDCRKRTGLSNVLYGLMRREQLAKTALFGNFVASDINLIVELTLYGKFHQLSDTLFSRRMHELSSSHDRLDEDLQRKFWDPTQRRLLMQSWRSLLAYFSAVRRAPLTAEDKRRNYRYLTKTMYWTKSELFSDLANYLRYGLVKRS